jgi:hypothetical protein
VQIPHRTRSNIETYVSSQEWRDARLSSCPLHSSGSCSFARHGSYARKTSPGLRIARWYCPEGRRTFSLLPDFLAARLSGQLSSIENIMIVASSAKSIEAAADALRGPEVTLPAAVRWLRRRIRAVRRALECVASAPEIDHGGGGVLLRLRRSLSPQILSSVPGPLGFQPV